MFSQLVRSAAASLFLGCFVAPCVWAQTAPKPEPPKPAPVSKDTYKTLEMNATLRDDASRRAQIKNTVDLVFKGEIPLADQAKAFDGWFTLYVFPQMTLPENRTALPKFREDFLKQYFRRLENPIVRARLNELTLQTMQRLAAGDFHPVVRYNAMLLIGELNESEQVNTGPNKGSAVPLAVARDAMLTELQNPKQIDTVKVAAVLGLLRHAELDRQLPNEKKMPAPSRALLVDKLALFFMQPSPEDREPEGHAWLQRRTMELFASLGQLDAKGDVSKALVAIAGDSKLSPLLRAEATVTLGKLAPQVKADKAETVKSVAALVYDLLGSEVEGVSEELDEEKKNPRGGTGIGVPSSVEPNFFARERAKLEPVRRRLKQPLMLVQFGLVGSGKEGLVAVMPADPEKSKLGKVAALVINSVKLLEQTDITRKEFVEALQPGLKELAALGGVAAPAVDKTKPASPDGDLGGDLSN